MYKKHNSAIDDVLSSRKSNNSSQQMFYGWPNFSRSSEKMTHAAPPTTSERVSLPPGTNCGNGNFIAGDELEYLSDQDIAGGRIPNSTNTNKNTKSNFIQNE